MASSGNELSERQRQRIEENRQKALERRKQSQRRQISSIASQLATGNGQQVGKNSSKFLSTQVQTIPSLQDCVVKEKENKTASPKSRTIHLHNQFQSKNVNSRVTVSHTKNGSNFPNKDLTKSNVPNLSTVQLERNKHDDSVFTSAHSSGFLPPENLSHNHKSANNGRGKKDQNSLSFSCPSEKRVKGFCVLISRERFCVNVGYHAQLIGVFKTIPSRSYDAKSTIWNFALEDYRKLMSAVKCLSPNVVLDELPNAVVSIFVNKTPALLKTLTADKINLNSVDSKLVKTLLPFQKEGVSFGIRHDGRLIIADDMGLGKTIQAICIASYYRAEWPLLVIVPSSVRLTWAQAFTKWLPSLDNQNVNVVFSGKDTPNRGLINIISYDLLSKMIKVLREKEFRVVIADECHFIKNFKATRTKAAMQLLKAATRVILLSGTPALSRPIELYTQICAVQPHLFPSYYDFGKRYCAGIQNRFGWDFSGASNMEELQLLLEEKIMIRRLKKDVLMQLPSKRRQLVILDSSMIKTKPLDKAARELNAAKKREKKGALLNYFCQTCSVKTQAVTQYLSDLLEGGHKFLVFAHHKEMLNAVSKFLTEKDHKFIRIDGSTTSAARQTLCDKFQKNHDHKAAVLSITAANTGLTLTEATAVVFAELFWNPGALMQAEDRAYRIGQTNSVNVHYLVAKGTADDYLWPLVQQKLEVLSQAGLGKNDFSEADNVKFEDPRQQKMFSFFETILEKSFEDFGDEEIAALEKEVLFNSEGSYQSPDSSTLTSEEQPEATNWFDSLSAGPNDKFCTGPSIKGSRYQTGDGLSDSSKFTDGEPCPKRFCR